MSRMPRKLATRAVVTGTVVLAGLCSMRVVGAQVIPADAFKIDRFANVAPPEVQIDSTVRITNPGNTGLRAWGTHIEEPGGGSVFVTETPFQDATLSSAERDVLVEKCFDIFENGSGFGQCRCEGETDALAQNGGLSVVEKTPPPGTLCANLYVFAPDQQLAECCACPLTPNGLIKLSVTNDLTANTLTGDSVPNGVIKLLSSSLGPLNDCDPGAPVFAPSPSTTTTTVPGSSTTTTTEATTSSTTTTTLQTGSLTAACAAVQDGFGRLDCTLGSLGADPGCDVTSISPPVRRLVVQKVNAMRSRLQGAARRNGPGALGRALARTNGALTSVQRTLARTVKQRRISPACEALLQGQLAGLRQQVAALRGE